MMESAFYAASATNFSFDFFRVIVFFLFHVLKLNPSAHVFFLYFTKVKNSSFSPNTSWDYNNDDLSLC